eukprot:1168670-Pyramimonas_sp.AAC.1
MRRAHVAQGGAMSARGTRAERTWPIGNSESADAITSYNCLDGGSCSNKRAIGNVTPRIYKALGRLGNGRRRGDQIRGIIHTGSVG